jgi:hypothetical protein
MHSEVTKDRTVRSDSQQPMLLPSEEKRRGRASRYRENTALSIVVFNGYTRKAPALS